MAQQLTRDEIAQLLVCPVVDCRGSLAADQPGVLVCEQCGQAYPRLQHTVDFIPATMNKRFSQWSTWEHLQSNGLVSYTEAPQQNLGVGARQDYRAFSQFCRLEGLVLDVGCGPQPWPTHFALHHPQTRFVGIDPLAPDEPACFSRFRAIAEALPLCDGVFDTVIFATSLDHLLDVPAALREACRVCRADGQIVIWSGEKSPEAPRPETSPEWYQRLEVPPGAEDPFHLKRFTEDEICDFFRQAGLVVDQHQAAPVDRWRTNHFYRTRSMKHAA